ncbi:MAG: ABC transporter permease [Firmicutes bacterium]|nr:ABC transporter permease [Bacillota bacterium]
MISEREKTKRKVIVFAVLAAILIVISLIAPLIIPNDPFETNAALMNKGPSEQFPLGTDRYGRCILSRVLMGAKTSIFSSFTVVAVTFVIGLILGLLCGYYGGVLDGILMRFADLMLSFPQMVIAIAVAGIMGGNLVNAMIAMGITAWPAHARLARSTVMKVKEEPYIAAAKLAGCTDFCIMYKYILPNVFGPLLINATTQIGTMMIGIAGLSFLGIGVIPPTPEWGSMINEARAYLSLSPWAVFVPGAAIVITVMVFNYFGDSLRDYIDVNGDSNG